jgi:hypothetical protein
MDRPDPSSIVDMRGPPEGGDSEAGEDGDLEAAADDILAAIEKKDPKALADALRAAVAMC